MNTRTLVIVAMLAGLAVALPAQEAQPVQSSLQQVLPDSPLPFQVVPQVDAGFVAVLAHQYRSGSLADGNTLFDFVRQGGQDNLYFFTRYQLDALLAGQHRISFLYQPLSLKTQAVSGFNGTGAVQIAGVDFPAGTPMDLSYGFDFYRLSYLYDFLPEPTSELGLGLSLQLRNASISFSSADGDLRTVQDNVGLVPIIKAKAATWFDDTFGIDFEADGFYASSAIFNGAGRDFEGWIWDAALALKARIMPGAVFRLWVRSIGGGASGSNAYDNLTATSSPAGQETYNSLVTLAPGIGLSLE